VIDGSRLEAGALNNAGGNKSRRQAKTLVDVALILNQTIKVNTTKFRMA
jgi:hypothetical protein